MRRISENPAEDKVRCARANTDVREDFIVKSDETLTG